MDTGRKGTISYQEFLTAFELQANQQSRAFFDTMDADGTGEINFREFIQGLAIANETDEDNRIYLFKLAFETQADKNGHVSLNALLSFCRTLRPDITEDQVKELFDLQNTNSVDKDKFMKCISDKEIFSVGLADFFKGKMNMLIIE